jgi:hypothetical protein
MIELLALTLGLVVAGGAGEQTPGASSPAATIEEYRAARQQFDVAMRAKAVIFADLPRELQQQLDKSNAAYSAASFTVAIEAMHALTVWAQAVVVDKAFVAEKFGRGTNAGRWFLRSPQLSEEQSKGIYARLDKAAGALNAEQLELTNGLLNELFDYLKTLPPPAPTKTPPAEP